MEVKQVFEYYTQENDTNKVINTEKTFIEGSVSVFKKESNAPVLFKEMGNKIIRLLEAVSKDEVLQIRYNITVSVVNTDVDILQTLRELQSRCENLERKQEYLMQALQERVPEKTFKQWILLMEKSFGKPVLDNTSLMGVAGVSLPKDKYKIN